MNSAYRLWVRIDAVSVSLDDLLTRHGRVGDLPPVDEAADAAPGRRLGRRDRRYASRTDPTSDQPVKWARAESREVEEEDKTHLRQ